MNHRLKAAWAAARTSAKREAGLFIAMMIFALVVALVAAPIILLFTFLPDWAWLVLFGIGVIWLIFGETIAAAIEAYRGEQP
jgi:hypothetical protein